MGGGSGGGSGAKDDESLDWSDDGLDAEEQVAQQKAILEFFESLKKVEDNAHARDARRITRSDGATPSTSPSRRTAASPPSIGNDYVRTRRDSVRRTRSWDSDVQRTARRLVGYKCSKFVIYN
jgi:Asp-tRNA(Asn)/Glu-tRNA(Gln) amidotransferase C subunit